MKGEVQKKVNQWHRWTKKRKSYSCKTKASKCEVIRKFASSTSAGGRIRSYKSAGPGEKFLTNQGNSASPLFLFQSSPSYHASAPFYLFPQLWWSAISRNKLRKTPFRWLQTEKSKNSLSLSWAAKTFVSKKMPTEQLIKFLHVNYALSTGQKTVLSKWNEIRELTFALQFELIQINGIIMSIQTARMRNQFKGRWEENANEWGSLFERFFKQRTP